MEGRRKDGWTEREIKGWKGEGRMDGQKKKENLNPELENTESKEYRI